MAGEPDLTVSTCLYCGRPIQYEMLKHIPAGHWSDDTGYARAACYSNPRPWTRGVAFGRHVPMMKVPTFATPEEAEQWLIAHAPS